MKCAGSHLKTDLQPRDGETQEVHQLQRRELGKQQLPGLSKTSQKDGC